MMELTSGEAHSLAEVKSCFSTLFNFMNSNFLPYGLKEPSPRSKALSANPARELGSYSNTIYYCC